MAKKIKIVDFLSSGCENALSLRDLSALLNLDGREIRNMIQRERLKGVPIISDNQNGYFLPETEGDLARFVSSMRRRATEILAVADAVERGCS